MIFYRGLFIITTVLLFSFAEAATILPRNLTDRDQVRVLEILGLGSAAKVLDNPYPLGGYTGIEIGLSSEFIPVEDLAGLGSGTPERGEFNYTTLTFGKGLYYNIDTHVYFTPFAQGEKFQSYGAQFRWGFYEADFFPLSLTALLYGGSANFSNQITVSTFGADVLATVNMDNVAIYFGGGTTRASGKFVGGANGIIADKAIQTTVEKDIVEAHTLFGINVDISKMFIAVQVDRYTDSVYSGKLGFRF